MAIGVAMLIALASVAFGFALTKGKSEKRKRFIWGLLLIFGIGPFVAWLIGIAYGSSVGDGFAAMGVMVLLYGVFFVVGLISLIIGVFTKS